MSDRVDPIPLLHKSKYAVEDEAYDIRIARDGTWFHEGRPIRRLGLAKLFATVLRRDEAGDYWLITPAEKGRIRVDDVPFVAVEMTVDHAGPNQTLTFRTNLDQIVTLGPEHPLRIVENSETGEPAPYILINGNLEARLQRSIFYDLVALAEERPTSDSGTVELGVWSNRTFFPLGRVPLG